jgi:siroheme decarboxylase
MLSPATSWRRIPSAPINRDREGSAVTPELSTAERQLLTVMQGAFPLTSRPFASLAQGQSGWSEDDVLEHIAALKQNGAIRQIGAIFDTRRLGYASTLVCARVAPERLDAVAQAINQHPGVSHNYGRDHAFNLWFTLAVPPGQDIERKVRALVDQPGVIGFLLLPQVRTFKLRVQFDLGEGTEGAAEEKSHLSRKDAPFDPQDIPLVRILQQDLPLVQRPFAALAQGSSFDEVGLLAGARRLLEQGIMRRYAAILRHRRVGYAVNAMVCWEVAQERLLQAGRRAAEHAAVSHCYERVSYPPVWPYQLFTMVHSPSEEELQRILSTLQTRIHPRQMAILRTVHEYKKVRLRYFEPTQETKKGEGDDDQKS